MFSSACDWFSRNYDNCMFKKMIFETFVIILLPTFLFNIMSRQYISKIFSTFLHRKVFFMWQKLRHWKKLSVQLKNWQTQDSYLKLGFLALSHAVDYFCLMSYNCRLGIINCSSKICLFSTQINKNQNRCFSKNNLIQKANLFVCHNYKTGNITGTN